MNPPFIDVLGSLDGATGTARRRHVDNPLTPIKRRRLPGDASIRGAGRWFYGQA